MFQSIFLWSIVEVKIVFFLDKQSNQYEKIDIYMYICIF